MQVAQSRGQEIRACSQLQVQALDYTAQYYEKNWGEAQFDSEREFLPVTEMNWAYTVRFFLYGKWTVSGDRKSQGRRT